MEGESSPLLLGSTESFESHGELKKEPSNSTLKPSPPVATLSLALSANPLLSSLKSSPPAVSAAAQPLAALPSRLKIPSQISSLSLFTLSTGCAGVAVSPTRRSRSSSSALLSSPFTLLRRPLSDPSGGAAARRCALLWFRWDLRIHDNEALNAASNESLSVLPVYLFDPRDYGKSSSGFDKTGPYRAAFLLQSVTDLRRSLRARGSDLVIRIGQPETVLAELVRAVGADAVYAHREVSHDEVRAEERLEKAMEAEGVEVKYFWGSTLYHIDDLPFDLEKMPSNYGGFKEGVQDLKVRKTLEALDQIKGLPSKGDVEPGEIPTLVDLGLNPSPAISQDGKPVLNASLVGGETEALERLKWFAAEYSSLPIESGKNGAQESIHGANFSCKISPWLAMGCLSPRFMFEELQKTANRTISAATKKEGGSGVNWLMFELMWRDFFRFITKKYSTKRKAGAEPITACAGALA
ncbi:Blue-light photoreceptor PHR2 [Apostasia shenzhenica]|uniref:Blue-light photoreceptor PHR2 n=1 Tax=Apostasia shenzhenica TaxID=1088818 RepID=A0A2I0A613_9ASPA|nr:Blue-light photoreceptor PHR2 [Apostasia shenzhenica]